MGNRYYQDTNPSFGEKNSSKDAQWPKGKSKPAGDPSDKEFKKHPHRSDEAKGSLPPKGAKK